MTSSNSEKKLNEQQKKAVEFETGPLLIIAGAGTGKTTVVTERIKHIVAKNLARPEEILALTFTEKAAREMESRVDEIMPYGFTSMWISTFHAFCDRILKAEAIQIGLNPGFKLISEAESTMMFRQRVFTLDLEYFRPLGNPNKFISGMLNHFSRLKDEDVTPAQYTNWVKEQTGKSIDFGKNQMVPSLSQDKNSASEFLDLKKYTEMARLYEFYEILKIKEGYMDFSDLISNTLLLFRTRENILNKYQDLFKFILVDEFQDTNIAQNELVKLLAGKRQNLTVVGDDDQSVYKFRGAAISNIVAFRKHFPKAKVIVLTENYRSTQSILDVSYALIQHNNPDRLEVKEKVNKKLHSMRTDSGVKPVFLQLDRQENEAEAVVREIKSQKSKVKNEQGENLYSWKDFAVLVRANSHAESFIRSFERLGVPYQFLGPGHLFKQPEIKELIAYLQVLNNFEDNVAFLKLLMMEYFALSAKDLTLMTNMSKRYGLTLYEASEHIIGTRPTVNIKVPAVGNDTKTILSQIIGMIECHLKLVRRESAGQLLFYFLEDSGMLPKILKYQFPIDEKKALNITKFFNKLKTYEAGHEDATVAKVLDWISIAMELGESPLASDTDWTDNDAVNILTVHSAKGLEFGIVFLVNLVSLRFPSTQRSEQIPIPVDLIKEELPQGDYHEEEERRLFYVGMTRAKDLLIMTSARFYGEGKREKKVSPFVYEALGEKVQAITPHLVDSQLSLLDWKKVDSQRNPEVSPTEGTHPHIAVTYLSYSQIEMFRTCPLHYKLRYILNIATPPSPALAFGSTMHATLKNVYELVQQKKSVTEQDAIRFLHQNWIREGYQNKEYERQMQLRAEKYLHDYIKKEFSPQTQILQLEQSFSVPITGNGRMLKIGGKIDRVDDLGNGNIEIIDYKTGRMPTRRELDANLQLSIYALAATLIPYPPFQKTVNQIHLSLYYFETLEKITLKKSQAQLHQARESILSAASEIERSHFNCSGSRLCVSCEYQMFCEQREI